MSLSNPLDLYEPLEIIGKGSFGVIRKVRRKADGEILARKELDFERMSERDRKQIVAEVNILKDLHHENIVRYIDRFVDRDNGILYILMEYCDGGDLSSVIKQCSRMNRPLPEDTVWSYFYQLLLALHHCHFPNSGNEDGTTTGPKRQQILHRDLKPENVFLSSGNTVKLGDFGLSKALGQTSFASTYVGTPYYMSPELIQEKSYDTKSDIWSLGCLIYELCAMKPLFHEAQTHAELAMLIRSGRIPPLPKGYSTALMQVIKAMLNLNPAMRPSAQQLLQHERIDFARKVSETEKMLTTVKAHKASLLAKERELQTLSATLTQREATMSAVMTQKDAEIQRLAALVSEADVRVKDAVSAREEELRVAVMQREEEVRTAMARREEEILDAVRRREGEINDAWIKREEELRGELSAAVQWVESRQKELSDEAEKLAEEADKLEKARLDLEVETEKLQSLKGKKEKKPLEEVKNLLAPFSRLAHREAREYENTPRKPVLSATITPSTSKGLEKFHALNTPLNTTDSINHFAPVIGSAMKGVILTATGETLNTPAPFVTPSSSEGAALTKIIMESPRVGLNFRKIFDFDSEAEDDPAAESADNHSEDGSGSLTTSGSSTSSVEDEEAGHPDTPSKNVRPRPRHSKSAASSKSRSQSEDKSSKSGRTSTSKAQLPPTRLRCPSIRTSSGRPSSQTTSPSTQAVETPSQTQTGARASAPVAITKGAVPSSSAPSQSQTGAQVPATKAGTQPAPPQIQAGARASAPVPVAKDAVPPTPRYDPSDEENLPSPFLRRAERERIAAVNARTGGAVSTFPSIGGARRKSNSSNVLRAIAAANSANNLNNVSPTTATAVKST